MVAGHLCGFYDYSNQLHFSQGEYITITHKTWCKNPPTHAKVITIFQILYLTVWNDLKKKCHSIISLQSIWPISKFSHYQIVIHLCKEIQNMYKTGFSVLIGTHCFSQLEVICKYGVKAGTVCLYLKTIFELYWRGSDESTTKITEETHRIMWVSQVDLFAVFYKVFSTGSLVQNNLTDSNQILIQTSNITESNEEHCAETMCCSSSFVKTFLCADNMITNHSHYEETCDETPPPPKQRANLCWETSMQLFYLIQSDIHLTSDHLLLKTTFLVAFRVVFHCRFHCIWLQQYENYEVLQK